MLSVKPHLPASSSAAVSFFNEAKALLSGEVPESKRLDALESDLKGLLSHSPSLKNHQAGALKKAVTPLTSSSDSCSAALWRSFELSLPNWTHVSHAKGNASALVGGPAKLDFALIQVNDPWTIRWFVVDCDIPGSAFLWKKKGLPAPHFVIVNPASKRTQWLYRLRTGVHTHDTARSEPVAFLNRINQALVAFGVQDPCFSMRGLVKNPLSQDWETLTNPGPAYSLKDLADCIPKDVFSVQRVGRWSTWRESSRPDLFEGPIREGARNLSLFDQLRLWAYREVQHFESLPSESNRRARWSSHVLEKAKAINQTFDPPLGLAEVKGVTRSVGNWVFSKYDSDQGATHSEEARKAQARGAKARRARREKEITEAIQILQSTNERVTVPAVAALIACSESTVKRYSHILPKRQRRKHRNPDNTGVAGQNRSFTSVVAPCRSIKKDPKKGFCSESPVDKKENLHRGNREQTYPFRESPLKSEFITLVREPEGSRTNNVRKPSPRHPPTGATGPPRRVIH